MQDWCTTSLTDFFQLSNIFKKYVNQVIRIFLTYLLINLFMATSYELAGAIAMQPGTISQALINFTTCTFINRLDRCSVLNYANQMRKNQNAFINLYKF